MKKRIITLIAGLCLAAPLAWAQPLLTPETAANMQKVFTGFSQFEDDIPGLGEEDEGISPLTPEGRAEIVEAIKASSQHAKALELVKDNGFDCLESFFDYVGRVSSASIAFGLETNGVAEVDMDMSGYMENLKQQGIPPEMLAEMEGQMASTLAMTKEMNAAAKAAKPEDIAAIKKYPEIMKILDAE